VTQVLDGPDRDTGCQRGDAAGPGMDHHLAGVVDRPAGAVKDVRVRDHIAGAVNAPVAATASVGCWAVVT
jgi:hypothetical protein